MAADGGKSKGWKEIDESIDQCQTTVCWEEDGVEAAKWRQMAVKVEDGR